MSTSIGTDITLRSSGSWHGGWQGDCTDDRSLDGGLRPTTATASAEGSSVDEHEPVLPGARSDSDAAEQGDETEGDGPLPLG